MDRIKDNLIPFFWPIKNQLAWFNPLNFNQKFAAFKQHYDPTFRNFVVLTVDEANAVEKLQDGFDK